MPILRVMNDLPSIGGIGSIPADAGRRQGREQRDAPGRKPVADAKPPVSDSGDDYPPAVMEEPAAKLVEALDRLRATHALAPSEETTRRLLHGKRYYQEQAPLPSRSDDGDTPFPDA